MQPRISQLPDPFKDDITYLSVPIKNVFFHCKLLTSICNVDYIPMNSSLYDYIIYIYVQYIYPIFPHYIPIKPSLSSIFIPIVLEMSKKKSEARKAEPPDAARCPCWIIVLAGLTWRSSPAWEVMSNPKIHNIPIINNLLINIKPPKHPKNIWIRRLIYPIIILSP